MSEAEHDFPFTWEATQNAKGYFQIRVKLKSTAPETPEQITEFISVNLRAALEGVTLAGFKIQPEEPVKTELKGKKELPVDLPLTGTTISESPKPLQKHNEKNKHKPPYYMPDGV
jgi:hypothetical protein